MQRPFSVEGLSYVFGKCRTDRLELQISGAVWSRKDEAAMITTIKIREVAIACPERNAHFETTLGARPFGWEYPDGESYATLQLPGALHVNSAQTYEAAALAGLGLIQAPLLGIGRYLESGELVEILPDLRRRSLTVSCSGASAQPVAPSPRFHEMDRKCARALP
jgi:DNA-binding transcriptional LysR family regulator